jgi:hypothetical protein
VRTRQEICVSKTFWEYIVRCTLHSSISCYFRTCYQTTFTRRRTRNLNFPSSALAQQRARGRQRHGIRWRRVQLLSHRLLALWKARPDRARPRSSGTGHNQPRYQRCCEFPRFSLLVHTAISVVVVAAAAPKILTNSSARTRTLLFSTRLQPPMGSLSPLRRSRPQYSWTAR